MLCLSTDLFQDVLKDTSGGQEAVVVTSEGKLIASSMNRRTIGRKMTG